jgi:tape measure domain-containing protein
MSKTDDRIVRMGFDNSKFESNAAKTMTTLDKLNEKLKLKGAAEGGDNLQKSIDSVNFASMERAILNIEKRFSTLGVVGMNVIGQITNGIVGSVKQLEAATIGQIKSGGWSRAMNIANAKFQIEGLGFAWEEVEKAVSYGVKDTAYGLDAAASAASQLAASGVDFKKTLDTVNGQDLTAMHKSLRAISGVAAMTNSSYEDIARIFTTVAGNGRLMGDQLLQLSSRGMNAAAKLAEVLNTSEEEVRNMVSRGKIDFQTFAFAMDDAFGAHAKEANKTFTGALGNMKAALSRVGEIFASPIINKTNTLFISLTERIDEFKNKLKSIKVPRTLDEIKKQYDGITMSATAYDQMLKSMEGRTITFGDHFSEMWQSGIDAFSEMIKSVDIGWFDKIVEKVDSVTVKIKEFFGLIKEIYGESAEEAADTINDATQTLTVSAEEAQAAKDILLKGMYGNGDARKANLVELFGGGEIGEQHTKNVQAYIDSVLAAQGDYEKATIKVVDANEELAKSQVDVARDVKKARIKAVLDSVKTSLSNLWSTAKNLGTAAKKIGSAILSGFSAVFKIDINKVTGGVSSFTEMIEKLSRKLIVSDDVAEKITKISTKFFEVVKTGIGYLEKAWIFAKNFVKSISESKTFETVKDTLSGLLDKISEFGSIGSDKSKNPIATFVTGIFDVLNNVVSSNGDTPSKLSMLINGIIDAIKSLNWKDISKIAGSAYIVYNLVKLVQGFDKLGNAITGIIEIPRKIGSFFSGLGESVKNVSTAYILTAAAKAIAVVAASLLVLSQIDETNLYRAIGTLVIIALVLKYLVKLASNIGKSLPSLKDIISNVSTGLSAVKAIGAFSLMFLAIAGAVMIMSVALGVITKTNAANGEAFLKLTGIMSLLTLVSYAVIKMISSIDKKTIIKMPAVMAAMSVLFVAIGGAVLAMSAAIGILSHIPSESFGLVVVLLGIMMGGMAIILNMATDVKPSRLLAASATIGAVGLSMSSIIMSVAGACFTIASSMAVLSSTGTDPSEYILTFVGVISALFLATVGLTEMANNVKNFASVSLTLLSMSVAMNSIGSSILLISLALGVISKSTGDDIGSALTVLAVIFGGLITIMYISTVLKPTQMLASAVMFIGVASAMLVLSAAVALLSRLGSAENMLAAAGSLVVALIGLGIAISIASASLGKAKNSAGLVIGGILAMSIVVAVIASAISKIGNVNHLLGATLSLGLLMVAIGATLAIVSGITAKKGSADSLIATGAAFVMVSASLLIMAFSIEKMAAVLNGPGVVGALVVMGAFIVIVGGLAIAAALIPGAALAFEAVGKAFLYAGIGAALVGAGVFLICEGIKVLAPAVGVLAISLEMLFTVLENHKAAAIAVGVIAVVLIAGIILAIMKLSPVIKAIADTISAVANRIGGTLDKGRSKLKDWASNLTVRGKSTIAAMIVALCGAIMKASPTVLNTVGQLLIKLLGFLGSIAGDLAMGLLDFVINLINGLADAIRANSARIAAALWGVVIALIDVVMQIIGQLIYMLVAPFSESMANSIADFVNSASDGMNQYALEQRKLAEEADQNKRDYINSMKEQSAAAQEMSEKSSSAFEALGSVIKSEAGEQTSELSKLKEEYNNLPGYAYDAILRSKNPEMFRESGSSDASNYADGFMSTFGGGGGHWGAEDELGLGLTTQNYEDYGAQNGTTYTTAEAMAISDGSDEIYDATKENTDSAQQAIIDSKEDTKASVQENFNDPFQLQIRSGRGNSAMAVEYVVAGMIQAMDDKKESYAAAAVRLAKAGNSAFEAENRIDSPSKLYYQNGEYIVQGLINGIEKNTDNAASTMGSLSDAILNSFGNPIDYLSKISTGELVYDPSIRPVFDSSRLYKGASSINSMLNQQTISVSGMSGKLAADIGTLDKGNMEVVAELRALREDMSMMQEAMENMQIVMDTGALVGSTVGAYDAALGKRQFYSGRGN